MGRWCCSYGELFFFSGLCLVGFVISDFASDSNECANEVVGLATCLSYVEGESKAPTPDCCSGLKQVLDKSRKCLCVLVKDGDNPNLGFKINATLALKLPGACNIPVNTTQCIDLLHLAPNSTDAKVFKEFGSGLQGHNSTETRGGGESNTSPSSFSFRGSTTIVKENGASEKGGKRWVFVAVSLWCLVFSS